MLKLEIPRCKNGHAKIPANLSKILGCKQCDRDRALRWQRENPEKYRAQRLRRLQVRGQRCTPQKRIYSQDHQLFCRYRIRKHEFTALLKSQDRKCAICSVEFSETVPPFVDHDHDTKRVRGLLCKKCNSGLGYLADSVERLKSALAYLSR